MLTSTVVLEGLPLASFRTIDIQKLRQDDRLEKKELLLAAKHEGFFYLNFQHLPELDQLESIIDDIYNLEHQLFNLPDTKKMAYDVDKQGQLKLNGYKPIGRNVGGVQGKRDGFESWAIPKDGVLGIGKVPFTRPTDLDMHMEQLQIFMKYMQVFTTIIHSALSDELGLEPQDRLESLHREDSSSPCILRLLKYHAQPATERGAVQTPHTDLGSLTILFTSQPGLQILPKGEAPDTWQFVAPRKHCAIVNIGDVLAMMTDGALQSSLHRVGPLPNLPMDTRYSFAYLQRPEEHTILKTAGAKGERITSGEWLRRKFEMLRKKTYIHDEQWVITGRKEIVMQA